MKKSLALIIEQLESRQTMQALSPKGVWDAALDQEIAALPLITVGTPKSAQPALIALKAGLHLLNESLDASHEQSQEIEDDPTGCYWHGIMHRMEGDFSNANYWFSNAGAHPAMESLQTRVADWLQNSVVLGDLQEGTIRDSLQVMKRQVRWQASALTGMIALQESGTISEEARSAIEYVQHMELMELFAYTHQAAKRAVAESSI
ncbi:hypothetical protein [Paenibacillus sp. CF384]|uniref:hypothetical protein n=1 Tax=Paenibacillus sp. CF384 TaxID=1884382 RepID=UPI00089A269F|nr:hypothetical protein [Paenibacillus sp. CF384]SDW42866.1 hypothetical protein SAMN05518855_100265 [Paenibacillus sp. CF384]